MDWFSGCKVTKRKPNIQRNGPTLSVWSRSVFSNHLAETIRGGNYSAAGASSAVAFAAASASALAAAISAFFFATASAFA